MNMLNSYYEIEQDGRKLFGNVSLKEFHQFRRDGEIYLFNVATMTPYRITEPVARLVDQASASFGGGLLSEQTMEELKKLDLVVGLERPSFPAPAVTAVEPSNVASSSSSPGTTPFHEANLSPPGLRTLSSPFEGEERAG